MAFNTSTFDSQHTPSDIDRKIYNQDLFDDGIESEHSLIDTGLLSPTSTDRKDSFATTSTIFSPQSAGTTWGDDYPVPSSATLSERHIAMGSHFTDSSMSNNPFHSQMTQWYKPQITPGTYDAFPENYDAPSTLNAFGGPTTFGGLSGHIGDNVRPAAIMSPVAGAPSSMASTSPMALAEQDIEAQKLNKRMRAQSPQRGLSARDGVRKKNARFEIPMERNLQNIDNLIASCQDDEDLLKELKQQKRLLRNRQAALDSRQRKKKHTESLEEEKKAWTERNGQLDVDLKELNARFETLFRETQNLHSINQNLEHQVQSLQNEKEEMISKHTLETGDLRRKISVLRDQLESSPASQPSHPSEYADFASELEGLNMGPEGDWSTWVTDFTDVDQSQPVQSKSSGVETTLVVGQRRKDTLMSEVSEKQMVPGGFLLLFLLYGAFVATRATGSAPLPAMSEEYRAEAAMILSHVLEEDSGVQQSSIAMLQAASSNNVQQVSWPSPSNTQSGSRPSFSQPANAGGLNALSQRLLTPSKQQEAEAAFSMTPAQFNSITSADYTRRSYESNEENARSSKGARKPLAEMIRANREENQQGANMAEVYTRSLMWDRIPTEVVQEFKRMVSRCPSVDDDIKADYDE